MGVWSGLGPAYNAHMRRLSLSKDDCLFTAVQAQRQGFVTARSNSAHPVLKQWSNFARTWGTPVGGNVNPGLSYRDGTVDEGSTIVGREQFRYDPVQRGETTLKLMSYEHEMLHNAVTHYIAGNIVSKLSDAAELAEPEPIFDTDLTSMHGFAVLEWPILLPDFHPDTGELDPEIVMPIRAIGWSVVDGILSGPSDARTVGRGIMMFAYTTPDDYISYYVKSMQKKGIEVQMPEGSKRDDFIPIDVLPWAFGTSWSGRESVDHQDTTVPMSVAFVRRWFLSLMRFTWQTLLVPSPEFPSKKVSSQWASLAKFRPHNDCTVMRLRRVVNPDGYEHGGTGVPLDHQVRVRGHWRRQWFRSLGPAYDDDGVWNPNSHRLVWIDDHWRGPEDAPVGAVRHATLVVR